MPGALAACLDVDVFDVGAASADDGRQLLVSSVKIKGGERIVHVIDCARPDLNAQSEARRAITGT